MKGSYMLVHQHCSWDRWRQLIVCSVNVNEGKKCWSLQQGETNDLQTSSDL